MNKFSIIFKSVMRTKAISAVSIKRILTMARTRPSCCALLVKMRFILTAEIAVIAMSMIGTVHAHPSWTGFYVGVNTGVAFNNTQLNSQQLGFTDPSDTCNTSENFSTLSSGVQFGYLYQFANAFVAGIEANTTFNTHQKNSFACHSDINSNVYDGFTFKNQLQTAIKARIGHVLAGNKETFLPYLTAGANFANVELRYQNEGGDDYSNRTTQLGWLIGAGIEWAFMQHWSLRAEYDYVDDGNIINLEIPSVYGLLDPNGHAQVNLKSNNVVMAINYWI